jgi:uncharacterized protein YhhL (DUF1145 family)
MLLHTEMLLLTRALTERGDVSWLDRWSIRTRGDPELLTFFLQQLLIYKS